MSLSRDRLRLPSLALAGVALTCAGVLVEPAAANAAPLGPTASVTTTVSVPTRTQAVTRTAAAIRAAKIRAVMTTAASLKGRPYRYGATGPRAFDCSGYVKYVFAHNGYKLPRTANQQYRHVKKIKKSQIRPGDLVFFGSGYKYHVAIYAGHGKIWHSPRPGKTVRKVKIWTSRWSAGRVIR